MRGCVNSAQHSTRELAAPCTLIPLHPSPRPPQIMSWVFDEYSKYKVRRPPAPLRRA